MRSVFIIPSQRCLVNMHSYVWLVIVPLRLLILPAPGILSRPIVRFMINSITMSIIFIFKHVRIFLSFMKLLCLWNLCHPIVIILPSSALSFPGLIILPTSWSSLTSSRIMLSVTLPPLVSSFQLHCTWTCLFHCPFSFHPFFLLFISCPSLCANGMVSSANLNLFSFYPLILTPIFTSTLSEYLFESHCVTEVG